jgi:transcriptional regulator with XRE-family HTH domain
MDNVPDPHTDPLAFGRRLQILRTRKGLTRDQHGGLIGRSGSWVKGVETGRLKTPKPDTILALAEALREFYLGKTGRGLRYLFTLGVFGIGCDLFTLPGQVREVNVRNGVVTV